MQNIAGLPPTPGWPWVHSEPLPGEKTQAQWFGPIQTENNDQFIVKVGYDPNAPRAILGLRARDYPIQLLVAYQNQNLLPANHLSAVIGSSFNGYPSPPQTISLSPQENGLYQGSTNIHLNESFPAATNALTNVTLAFSDGQQSDPLNGAYTVETNFDPAHSNFPTALIQNIGNFVMLGGGQLQLSLAFDPNSDRQVQSDANGGLWYQDTVKLNLAYQDIKNIFEGASPIDLSACFTVNTVDADNAVVQSRDTEPSGTLYPTLTLNAQGLYQGSATVALRTNVKGFIDPNQHTYITESLHQADIMLVVSNPQHPEWAPALDRLCALPQPIDFMPTL